MIIMLSFETEYTSFGGLGAVMKLLPNEIGKDECIIMAPLFSSLVDLDALKKKGRIKTSRPLFSLQILIRGAAYRVDVIQAVNDVGLVTYFLSSPDYFNAKKNPYINPCDLDAPLDPFRNPVNSDKLTEDALFFSIAAPVVLVELVKEGLITDRNPVLHLQDWETAAVARAVRLTSMRPALESVRCVLTIHNPYDKPLSVRNSPKVCDLARHLNFALDKSILQQVIPLLDAPVSTVSKHFAHELRNEVLYTQIFCPHLQPVFQKYKLVGVDNGNFGTAEFPFSKQAFTDAEHGDFTLLREEKWARRANLSSVVNEYLKGLRKDTSQEFWGGELDLSDPAIPVFFMLGRDDPRQKGFDVIVDTIASIPRGVARYIFAVMPGDEGLPGLRFLRALAEERPDEVCVLPFRVDKDVFAALQEGSSFMVMASMYEPFGAANEAYTSGMPVIARATGGLIQQVVPHRHCMENEDILGLYGRQIVRSYHTDHDGPTGILFREQVSFAEESEGWRDIVDCSYWQENPVGDRLASRRNILLFNAMVKSAAAAFRHAVKTYGDQPEYAAMVYNGWKKLQTFRWDHAVADYDKYLYRAGE